VSSPTTDLDGERTRDFDGDRKTVFDGDGPVETTSVDAGRTATDPESSRSRSRSRRQWRGTLQGVLAPPAERVLAVSALATAVVALATVLRVLYNVPFDPVPVSSEMLVAVGVFATVLVGLALSVTALAARAPAVRVGLLFAGVFGVIATVANAAAIAALVAVTGGGAFALAGALGAPATYRGVRRRVVAAGFVLAVAVSLASTTGILDAGLRGVGTVLYLASLTLLAIRSEGEPVALVAGALGFVGVVVAGAAMPYVAGSALLVGFGVVGGPHVLVATGAFGAIAAATAGVRRGEYGLVLGATLALTDPDALGPMLEPNDDEPSLPSTSTDTEGSV
jgi:hypothetical protein